MPVRTERGMILINVLLFVAIAAGLVMLMISAEDVGAERAIKMREAERALAIAYGGELSAVVALRRDMEVAPDADYAGESWAALAEDDAPIEDGRFQLAIADAQGRFNVNALMSGEAEPVAILARIIERLGMRPELTVMVTQHVRLNGPVADLAPMAAAGLDPETLTKLLALVTALPGDAPVNANSAGEPLLAIMLNDADAAKRLVDLRRERGYLLPEDMQGTGLSEDILGVTSSHFWVRTRVTIGDTRQQLTSLIIRSAPGAEREPVAVASRWRGDGGPPDVPRLGL